MSQERAWNALASNASSRHMQAENLLNEELAGSCCHFSHAAMEWCSARGKHIKRDMHNSPSQKMTARQSPSGSGFIELAQDYKETDTILKSLRQGSMPEQTTGLRQATA